MPTYVYECSACKKEFETGQRITEDPLSDCPHCKKKKVLKRLIQPTAVMFKGAGFYVNDSQEKTETQSEPCGSDCACNPPSDKD